MSNLLTVYCTCLSCTILKSFCWNLPFVSLMACYCTCLSRTMVSRLSVEILISVSSMAFDCTCPSGTMSLSPSDLSSCFLSSQAFDCTHCLGTIRCPNPWLYQCTRVQLGLYLAWMYLPFRYIGNPFLWPWRSSEGLDHSRGLSSTEFGHSYSFYTSSPSI